MRAQIAAYDDGPAAAVRRVEAAHHPGRLPQVPRRAAQGARNPPHADCIRGIHTAYPSPAGRWTHPNGGAGCRSGRHCWRCWSRGRCTATSSGRSSSSGPGSTWPLNVGQVYTTLNRLERDGLVEGTGADDEGHVSLPRHRGGPGRGVGVVHHAGASHPAPARRAGDQARHRRHPARASTSARSSSRSASPRCPRSRTTPGSSGPAGPRTRGPDDLAWSLVLDSLVFAAEAEIRWLDHCEARLRRAASSDG